MDKEKELKCKRCGETIDEIYYRYEGVLFYRVKLSPDGFLDYELEDIEYTHDGAFICPYCGEELYPLTEEGEKEVIEILKRLEEKEEQNERNKESKRSS
jgi:DNA-directed RNA polymerase subunit RPC12/RpoP